MKIVIGVALSLLMFNANAVVFNTLNGVDYEWLELTATVNMSRPDVEAELSDVSSTLYGYEYASRYLLEELFNSYTNWDGLDGLHANPEVLLSQQRFMNDFGVTDANIGTLGNEYHTVDGYTVIAGNNWNRSFGYYGEKDSCGIGYTCTGYAVLFTDENNRNVMTNLDSIYGWDSASANPYKDAGLSADSRYGSYLVRASVSTVPIPAAVWLFGSGLIGLIGLARRKA